MEDLARALVAFFAIIDPVGNVLVFHLYTAAFSVSRRVQTAAIAVFAAFVMLLAFALGGTGVLDFLGISTDSFKVAAGLLLLLPAYRLVSEGQPVPVGTADGLEPGDIGLVPLATPLLAGPGALAATISFADDPGIPQTIAAFSIVLAASFAAFVSANWLFSRTGPSLLRLLSRIVGILLFAIAVNLVLDGVRHFATS